MTQLEIEALILFKDYTHLQLKAYKIHTAEESKKYASGATESYDAQILDKALEYHNIYLKFKLNQKKNG